MIARIWQAEAADVAGYQRIFQHDVIAELTAVDGFRGAWLLGSGREIRTVTLFDSLADARRFAGEHHDTEHVSAAARAVLLRSDQVVRHFDVLVSH